mgnify:CR=1 FL=1
MTPESLVGLARQKGALIATAESCTGGLVAGAITDVPGSSDVFERGFVTYSNAAKVEMLGVDQALISEFGAVSEEVARAMAEGALMNSEASLAVAVTGIAGPGGSEHKPEGRVCFALAMNGRETMADKIEFGAIGRANVRQAAVAQALSLLAGALS